MPPQSPHDLDLAIGFFKQACFDLLNAENLQSNVGANALRLAQCQQACEKALKAFVLIRVGRSSYCKPGHRVLTSDLQNDSLNGRTWNEGIKSDDLKQLRDEINELCANMIEGIKDLENIAPAGWSHPNTEYPWIAELNVFIPSDHFVNDHQIVNSCKVARAVVKSIKSKHPKFIKGWETVKTVFSNL